MRPISKATISALAAMIGLSLTAMAALADGKVGVASAVKNDVQGRGSRAIAVGAEVYANERIRTGDASTAQFMFLDKTVMSLGPKAELVLDKYVFNPNRGSGQVVVNAVQGSMRFVTGAQNPTSYQIKTPVATLGIRGTVVDLSISQVQTFVGLIEGSVLIRFLDGTTLTIGKGEFVVISATGQVIRKGPYNGSDPTTIEMVDFNRINEINQLNAIDVRGYTKPQAPPPVCVPSYMNYNCGYYN